MAITVVLQVRHKLVNQRLGRSEGVPGREVDVPDNLVHSYETGEVATLR